MAIILHLGVHDHTHPDLRHSTGELADILEGKYHLFQTFYEMHEKEIGEIVVNSYANAFIDKLLHGAPLTLDPGAGATSKIERMLKDDISQRMFDGRIAGVPTQAAIAGRSKRFKRGYNPRGSRPSFIDTGAFQSSITAWTSTSK